MSVQNTFICIVHYSRVQFFKDCIKLYSILTNNRVLSKFSVIHKQFFMTENFCT